MVINVLNKRRKYNCFIKEYSYIEIKLIDAVVSEDSLADESGSHPDTDAPVAVKSEVPTWNETPKESEAK